MMEPILRRSSLRASHVGGAPLHALLSKEGGEAMKRASKVRDHGKKKPAAAQLRSRLTVHSHPIQSGHPLKTHSWCMWLTDLIAQSF